ncbi:MAG: hypothetical protein FRC54_05945 [bacterium LCO1.1]|uniref:Uncharacterized protein n=1 Tax=Candidatus Weimeria bifida TaxID=2599074 RepID=A0A6N7IYM8_9FIRM|nr:hypothetical protein [Candidatus Weimeria bifida]
MVHKQITEIQKELSKIEDELHQKCHEIPNVENVLEIEGLGENILSASLQKWETSPGSMM